MSSGYTQADLDSIDAAISSGALKIQYNDRTTTYRSIKELKEARTLIRQALGLTKKGGRLLLKTSKGTC